MSTKKERQALVQKALQPDPRTGKLSEEFIAMAWALVQGEILRAGLDKVPTVRIKRSGMTTSPWWFTVTRGRGGKRVSKSAFSLRDAVEALKLHDMKGTAVPGMRKELAKRMAKRGR